MMQDPEPIRSSGLPVVVSCACFGLCRGEITALRGDVFTLTSQVNMVDLGDHVSLTVTLDDTESLVCVEGVVCGQSQDGFAVRLLEPDRGSRELLRRAMGNVSIGSAVESPGMDAPVARRA